MAATIITAEDQQTAHTPDARISPRVIFWERLAVGSGCPCGLLGTGVWMRFRV